MEKADDEQYGKKFHKEVVRVNMDILRETMKKRREERKRMEEESERRKEKVSSIGTRRLEPNIVLEVIPYIHCSETIVDLMCVGKKYRDLNLKIRENPYDIRTKRDKKLFEHVDTVVIYTPEVMNTYYEMIKEERREKKEREERKEEKITKSESMSYEMVYGTEEDRKKVRRYRLSEEPFCMDKETNEYISMQDVGNVLAPIFKQFTNIRIELEERMFTKRTGDDQEIQLFKIQEFMRMNDKKKHHEKYEWSRTHENDERIEIPDEWRMIPKKCFSKNKNKEIVLTENIIYIDEGAFTSCIYIERIVIPSSVKVLGERVFEDCLRLKEVIFRTGSELKEIRKYCFRTTQIREIRIPDGCEIVEYFFMTECEELKVIHLPMHLKEMPVYLVRDCPKLERIEVPERLKDKPIQIISEKVVIEYY